MEELWINFSAILVIEIFLNLEKKLTVFAAKTKQSSYFNQIYYLKPNKENVNVELLSLSLKLNWRDISCPGV